MNTASSSLKKGTYSKFGKGDNRSLVSSCQDINELKRILGSLIQSYRPEMHEVQMEFLEQEQEGDDENILQKHEDSQFLVQKILLFLRPAGVDFEELMDSAIDSKSYNQLQKLLNDLLDYYELE